MLCWKTTNLYSGKRTASSPMPKNVIQCYTPFHQGFADSYVLCFKHFGPAHLRNSWSTMSLQTDPSQATNAPRDQTRHRFLAELALMAGFEATKITLRWADLNGHRFLTCETCRLLDVLELRSERTNFLCLSDEII